MSLTLGGTFFYHPNLQSVQSYDDDVVFARNCGRPSSSQQLTLIYKGYNFCSPRPLGHHNETLS